MNPLPSDPVVPTSLVAVLIIAVTTLAGVIAYLFHYYSKRLKDEGDDKKRILEAASSERFEFAKERALWLVERTKHDAVELQLRAEYESKHRQIAEAHAKTVQEIHDDARAHEDLVRREYTQNMETIAGKAEEAQARMALVFEKLHDRLAGSRRR